jgi:competence protein ComEA
VSRWKEHLAFNKRERYGVVVLCSLLFVVSLLRASWDVFFPPMYPEVDFNVLAEKFERPKKASLFKGELTADKDKPKVPKPITDFFDPNIISADEWRQLGFSQKQAASLVNYRGVIGGFYSAKDVGSSFVVSEEKLALLMPWMVFTMKEIKAIPEEIVSPKMEMAAVELNQADSAELLVIRGVGPFYAGKITQLRANLGGFSSYDQLLSLYGMDSIKIEAIQQQTTLNLELVRVRNINQLGTKELASHTFINYNLARGIVKYREQHGDYKKLEDLLKVHLMNDSILIIIRPFFAVHD